MRTVTFAALMIQCAVAMPCRAQELARIVKGTVIDAGNRKPIAGALIYVGRTQADDPSDRDGTFKVEVRSVDRILIARRPGYVPERMEIPAGERGTESDLGIVSLRQVKNDADRAQVRAIDLEIHPRLASFYERKDKYKGAAFFTPDEMERSSGAISQMVRARTGFRNICVENRQGELDCGKTNRGPSTIMGSGQSNFQEQQMCFVRVWTDDVGPERALDDMRPDEILAMEAYPNSNTTPREFPGSDCATIRLWMKVADSQ